MITDIKSKLIPFSSLDEASKFIIENKGMYISMNLQALVEDTLIDLLDLPNVYGYVDGIGAQAFLNSKYGVKAVKIPGCELWLHILKQEKVRSYSIAVIGASVETNRKTVEKLRIDYPLHRIDYYVDGYHFEDDELIRNLSKNPFDFVFIALGQPRQELLGMKILNSIGNVTILGLGGSFDVYCGAVNRAPNIFISLRAEWLYRILTQPRRTGKLISSVCKYIILLLR